MGQWLIDLAARFGLAVFLCGMLGIACETQTYAGDDGWGAYYRGVGVEWSAAYRGVWMCGEGVVPSVDCPSDRVKGSVRGRVRVDRVRPLTVSEQLELLVELDSRRDWSRCGRSGGIVVCADGYRLNYLEWEAKS